MSNSAIYFIRHVESGKVYVGSAVRLNARWATHRHQLSRGTHGNRHLQAAWAKHGASAFEFGVLETVADANDLLERENFWMKSLCAIDPKRGFNICKEAGSRLGMKHSDEARVRMSQAARKKKTAEHVAAVAEALKGRKLSDECKAKLAECQRGRKASILTRKKMSEARQGKRLSAEAKAKISTHLVERHAAARAAGLTLNGKPLMGYALKQALHDAA